MKFKKNERHHQENNSFLRNLAREETLEFKLGCFLDFTFVILIRRMCLYVSMCTCGQMPTELRAFGSTEPGITRKCKMLDMGT